MGAAVRSEERTPEEWRRKCLDKVSYDTEWAARRQGFANVTRPGPKKTRPAALYVYACDICGGFHLTRSRSGAPITPESMGMGK